MFGFWLVGLVVPSLVSATHHPIPGTDRLAMAVEFTPLLRLPEFIVGVLLGRLYLQGARLNLRMAAAITYVSVSLVILTLAAFSSVIPHLLLSNGLLLPLFALLIWGLADGRTQLAKILSWAPLVLLGEASYGVYILQIPVSYILRSPPPLKSVVSVSIYLIVLIAVSLLSWRFVEAPLRIKIRQWLSNSSGTEASRLQKAPPTDRYKETVHS